MNSKDETIYVCTVAINNVYQNLYFLVEPLYFDGEFLLLENLLFKEQIYLNKTAKNEHVGEVERLICTMKE